MATSSVTTKGLNQEGMEQGSFPALHCSAGQRLGDSRSTAPSSSSSRGHSADDLAAGGTKVRKSHEAPLQLRSPVPGYDTVNELAAAAPKDTSAKSAGSPSGGRRRRSPSGDVTAAGAGSESGTVSPPSSSGGRSTSLENLVSKAEVASDGTLKWNSVYCKHFLFGRCARRRCRFLHGDAEVVQQQRRLLEMATAAAAAVASTTGTGHNDDSATKNGGATNSRPSRDRKAPASGTGGGGAVLVRNEDRREDANEQGSRFFGSHAGGTPHQHQRRGSHGGFSAMGPTPPNRFVHYQPVGRSMNGPIHAEVENQRKQGSPNGSGHRGPPGVSGHSSFVPFYSSGAHAGAPIPSSSPLGAFLSSSSVFPQGRGAALGDSSNGNPNFYSSQAYLRNGQNASWSVPSSVPPPPSSAPALPYASSGSLYGMRPAGEQADDMRRPPTACRNSMQGSHPPRRELDFAQAMAFAAAEQLTRNEENFAAAKAASAAAQLLAAQIESSQMTHGDGARLAVQCQGGFPYGAGTIPFQGVFAGSPATAPTELRFVQAAESLAERYNLPFVTVYLPGQGYIIQFIEGAGCGKADDGINGMHPDLMDSDVLGKFTEDTHGCASQGSAQLVPADFIRGICQDSGQGNDTKSGIALSAKPAAESGEQADLAGENAVGLSANSPATTRSWLDVLKHSPCKAAAGEKKADRASSAGPTENKPVPPSSSNFLGVLDGLREVPSPATEEGSSGSPSLSSSVAPQEDEKSTTSTGWPSLTRGLGQEDRAKDSADGEQAGERPRPLSPRGPREPHVFSRSLGAAGGWPRGDAGLAESGFGGPAVSQQAHNALCGHGAAVDLCRYIAATEGQGESLSPAPHSTRSLSMVLPSHGHNSPRSCHTFFPSTSFANPNQVPDARPMKAEAKRPQFSAAEGSAGFTPCPSLPSTGLLRTDKEGLVSEGFFRFPDFPRQSASRQQEDLQKLNAGKGDSSLASSLFSNPGTTSQQDSLLSRVSGTYAAPQQLPYQAGGDHPPLSLQQQMAVALSQARTTTGGPNTFSSASLPWLVSDLAASTTEGGCSGLGDAAGELSVFSLSTRAAKGADALGLSRCGRLNGDNVEGIGTGLFAAEDEAALALSQDTSGLLHHVPASTGAGLKTKSSARRLSAGWFAAAFQNRGVPDVRPLLDDFSEKAGRVGRDDGDDKLSKVETHFTLKGLDSRRSSGPTCNQNMSGLFRDVPLSPTAALIASIWQKAGIEEDDEIPANAAPQPRAEHPQLGVSTDSQILSSF
ncbi:hypothetical protein BESB_026750 [Besnoitia besnoiti]|uniref:C3H1-type domain-containing protein n=1 Tax=Besnoitia besnoiti TaxID=94643 RepID=A0A2A9M5W2_BESBE|nr:uncharacterized protein BESB_026750 [Besnoitia besnoiti]PFH31701.1 hypothetical protein BESB_026750 [Besnoitia besnoiti]